MYDIISNAVSHRRLDRDLTEGYWAKGDPDIYLKVTSFDRWGRTQESRRRNTQIAKLIDATLFEAAPEIFAEFCPWVPKPRCYYPLVWAKGVRRLVTLEPVDPGGELTAEIHALATTRGWAFLRLPAFGIHCTPDSHFSLLSPLERGIDVQEVRNALEGIAQGRFKKRPRGMAAPDKPAD